MRWWACSRCRAARSRRGARAPWATFDCRGAVHHGVDLCGHGAEGLQARELFPGDVEAASLADFDFLVPAVVVLVDLEGDGHVVWVQPELAAALDVTRTHGAARSLQRKHAPDPVHREFDELLQVRGAVPVQPKLSGLREGGVDGRRRQKHLEVVGRAADPVGQGAGRTAAIGGNVLRRGGMTIMGSGSMPGLDFVKDVWRRLMEHTAAGDVRIEIDTAPLSDIESVWDQDSPGRRTVITI